MKLTSEQKSSWKNDGHLAVENVIPAELVATERERFDWWCQHWDCPEATPLSVEHETSLPREKWTAKTVRKIHRLEQFDPVFHAHAFHANLLDLVSELIGTPFSLYETQAFLKPPSFGSPKPPHQDNAYFKVKPADAVITCWGAVDDATIENGCMQYYPRSHKAGMIEHKWIEGTPHQVPVGFDTSKLVPVPIKAGGVIFHHGLALHMSLENRSQNWRRAFACHYIRTDADMTESPVTRDKLTHARS